MARRLFQVPRDSSSRASSADPLDLIDNESSRASSNPPSPLLSTNRSHPRRKDEDCDKASSDEETGTPVPIKKKRRRIMSDEEKETPEPDPRLRMDSSAIDQPTILLGATLPPISADGSDTPILTGPSSRASTPVSISPFTRLVPPGHDLAGEDESKGDIGHDQAEVTIEAEERFGLPTPPVTSVLDEDHVITGEMPGGPDDMADEVLGLVGESIEGDPAKSIPDDVDIEADLDQEAQTTTETTISPDLADHHAVADEEAVVEANSPHVVEAEPVPSVSALPMPSVAYEVADRRVDDVSEVEQDFRPAMSSPAIEEGEEELDPDALEGMDMDPTPDATPVPVDAAESGVTSTQKSKAKVQKPKAKTEKKSKAKPTSQGKGGTKQAGKSKGKTKVRCLSHMIQTKLKSIIGERPQERELQAAKICQHLRKIKEYHVDQLNDIPSGICPSLCISRLLRASWSSRGEY